VTEILADSPEYWPELIEDDPCEHDCIEHGCEEGPDGRFRCYHQHCGGCGGCSCPGYCDDYQTYNLRPAETGGTAVIHSFVTRPRAGVFELARLPRLQLLERALVIVPGRSALQQALWRFTREQLVELIMGRRP
jgi:hypothetical protein